MFPVYEKKQIRALFLGVLFCNLDRFANAILACYHVFEARKENGFDRKSLAIS